MEDAAENEIAQAILHYLHAHPDAKDTLEGIAQWWLLNEWTERRLVVIEKAVSTLLSQGLIVERRREGSRPYYWLNRDREKEIAQILNKTEK